MKKGAKKRLIIVHGWEGCPEEAWFPWLKVEMEKRGWEVTVPAMPDTNKPKLFEWLPFLEKTAGEVGQNTFMVGHSLGCITILRFLEGLNDEKRIGGAIFVAGFDNPLKFKELKNFFQEPISWAKIKERCKKFVAVHSEDDIYVPVENSASFRENLGAKTVIVDGFGHFSGSAGITSLPIVLQELLEISKQ